MLEFRDYDVLFPELVYDIVNYFWVNNVSKKPIEKSIINYCCSSHFNPELSDGGMIQPDVVFKICENLIIKGVLICTRVGYDGSGLNSNYLYMTKTPDLFQAKPPEFVFRLNCMAYGFRYIYSAYSKYVLPIVVKKDGIVSVGTCFRFINGIVTAKHCIEVDQVSIPGYKSDMLKQCNVYISKDESIDLAYIDLGEPSELLSEEARVMDEVLVIGYPRIPLFMDFCAVERATVSSIPTRGAVASLAEQYISKRVGSLMLVTARIRGGNSGGPIINSNGAVVGVAFSEPFSEGDYDEMGYGIAYPISALYSFLHNPIIILVDFVDAFSYE